MTSSFAPPLLCGAAAAAAESRYDQYCTRFGCFSNVVRDDIENQWPSLAWGGLTLYPDPRVPSVVRDGLCGPFGCAAPQPLLPSGALVSAPVVFSNARPSCWTRG